MAHPGDGPGEGGGATPRALDPKALLAVLARHRVGFVVIGGFSLAVHGYVRATKDVDIVPEPSAANLDRLAAALHELRATVDLAGMSVDELGIEPDADRLRDGGNWFLQTRHGRLDVMQHVPGLRSFEQLRAGAVEVDDVLYAGYEELIAMKVASGHEEDLRDIAALEAAQRDR